MNGLLVTPSPYAAASSSTTGTETNGEYRFNFGRHRGKTVYEAPESYVRWCIREHIARNRRDTKFQAALDEFERRYPSFEQRMQAVRQRASAWLYDTCDEAFDDVYGAQRGYCSERVAEMIDREKVEAFKKMGTSLAPLYPPRPPDTATLPESESVKALRIVLSLLPEEAWKEPQLYGIWRQDRTDLVCAEIDGFTGYSDVYLTEHCRAELRRLLDAIEQEHGKGVRALADWEVYDKLSASAVSPILRMEEGFMIQLVPGFVLGNHQERGTKGVVDQVKDG